MLYPQLLRHEFDKLPRALREFHSAPGGGSATGTVDVRRERGWLASLIGFPASGIGIPLRLQVIARENEEVWIRRFGDQVRRTVQRCDGDLLLETAGPVRLFFRVFADSNGMRLESQRARLWMFPVPLRIQAQASGTDSSWEFQVTVRCVGSYRGTVVPAL